MQSGAATFRDKAKAQTTSSAGNIGATLYLYFKQEELKKWGFQYVSGKNK